MQYVPSFFFFFRIKKQNYIISFQLGNGKSHLHGMVKFQKLTRVSLNQFYINQPIYLKTYMLIEKG